MTEPLISKVIKHALSTFSSFAKNGTINAEANFRCKINELTSLISSISKEDVQFNFDDVQSKRKRLVAPVTYIDVFDDSVATAGIFVLNRAFALPLHDHPSMYGFIKVISGRVKVRAFSEIKTSIPSDLSIVAEEQNARVVPVKLVREFVADESSPAATLTPTEANFHSITAEGGPAAFFDLLSPPYELEHMTRPCRYYQEIQYSNNVHKESGDAGMSETADLRFLVETQEPDEFFCDHVPYSGPSPKSRSHCC